MSGLSGKRLVKSYSYRSCMLVVNTTKSWWHGTAADNNKNRDLKNKVKLQRVDGLGDILNSYRVVNVEDI